MNKKLTELITGEEIEIIMIGETRVGIAHENIKPIGKPVLINLPDYCPNYTTPKEVVENAPENANAYLKGKRVYLSVCLKGDLAVMMTNRESEITETRKMDIHCSLYPVQYYRIRK
jgi:hypothetical protein